jgi:hypothetical protein
MANDIQIKRYGTIWGIILFLAVFMYPLVLADVGYSDCTIYGNCQPAKAVTSSTNYSLINVNNSLFLNNHPDTYFQKTNLGCFGSNAIVGLSPTSVSCGTFSKAGQGVCQFTNDCGYIHASDIPLETDPVFTSWYSAGNPTLTSLKMAGGIITDTSSGIVHFTNITANGTVSFNMLKVNTGIFGQTFTIGTNTLTGANFGDISSIFLGATYTGTTSYMITDNSTNVNTLDIVTTRLNITENRICNSTNACFSLQELNATGSGSGSTYNATYNGLINNASYLSTFNATYDGLIRNSSYLNNLTNLAFANQTNYFTGNQTIRASTSNWTLGGFSIGGVTYPVIRPIATDNTNIGLFDSGLWIYDSQTNTPCIKLFANDFSVDGALCYNPTTGKITVQDATTFQFSIFVNFTDGTNIGFGTKALGGGTRIGTGTTQKLAFWNSAPIIQPIASTAIDTLLTNTGLRATGGWGKFTTNLSTTQNLDVGGNTTVTGICNLLGGNESLKITNLKKIDGVTGCTNGDTLKWEAGSGRIYCG